MGAKRQHHDNVHPSRRQNLPFPRARSAKRQRHESGELGGQILSTKSPYILKQKIRDLKRLLAHNDRLPADVRMEKERALASYEADLTEASEEKKKSKMISKYHMVRFFGKCSPQLHIFERGLTAVVERQKATRALKRLRKQLEATSVSLKEHHDLEIAAHEAEVDLNYTMFYPLAEKYYSLYPRTVEQGPENEKEIGGRGERKVGAQRPPLWSLIERSMAEGTLEALRDGKGGSLVVERPKPPPQQKASVETSRKPKHNENGGGVKLTRGAVSEEEDDDEMSDGGFFER